MESSFFCSLFEGDSPTGAMLGMGLTGGEFWPRPNGCMIIYRGQDSDVDYDSIQGVMEIDDSQAVIDNQFLPPNTIWHYVRCQVSGCGLESEGSSACIIRIDENGDMLGDMPNVPIPLEAMQQAGGKIRLQWRYSPLGQEIAPTNFNIYIDTGEGFDYSSPVDTVDYDLGRAGEFTWTSPVLDDGKRYRFVVRSDHAAEAETRNTMFVTEIADSSGPQAITGINASWQEDQ